MPRARLIAPSITLARDGFIFEPGDLLPFTGSRMEGYSEGLNSIVSVTLRRSFYRAEGSQNLALDSGNRNLHERWELIARGGTAAFYHGAIARAMVAASTANGGILSLKDSTAYRVEEAAPLRCAFRGYDIISAPPPSSGGVTLREILNIIAPFPLERWGWHDVRSLHYVTEANGWHSPIAMRTLAIPTSCAIP